MDSRSIFQNLPEADIRQIKTYATLKSFKAGDLIFCEGEQAESFYIIQAGNVSIYFDKGNYKDEVYLLGAGDHFGEIAILNKGLRSASAEAVNDVSVLSIEKQDLLEFLQDHPEIAHKIHDLISQRNEELILKESLIDTSGINSRNLHLSIKGDPSMRESAFYRDRHESIVDRLMSDLIPGLKEMLVERSLFRVYIGFNSGEIRTESVFDPFNTEVHEARKLTDQAYISRHFPAISYDEKTQLVRQLYASILGSESFANLPAYWRNILRRTRSTWQPISKSEICKVIEKVPTLRNIPSFYLRNMSISIIQDAIRMQFNCDGTHIVSTDDFQRFLDENIED